MIDDDEGKMSREYISVFPRKHPKEEIHCERRKKTEVFPG